MTELMTMDFIGRIHREDDGRIIIEIPEVDQNYLAELLEDVPLRITVETIGLTNKLLGQRNDVFLILKSTIEFLN
jgi:hypothetical protein